MFSRLHLLVLLVLTLTSCFDLERDRLQMLTLGGEPWTRMQPRGVDWLVREGSRTYQLDLMIRHRGEIDSTRVRFELSVLSREIPLYRDTLELTFATQPRKWLGERVATQELDVELDHALRLPYAGIYRLELRPLRETPLLGVESLGFRLSPKD